MKLTCQQCKGDGAYWANIRNGSQITQHYVSCDVAGCNKGIVDTEEQYRILWGENNKKPFEFEVTNGILTINCLQFATNEIEANRIVLAQHGKGWKIKLNEKYSPFSEPIECHQSFA